MNTQTQSVVFIPLRHGLNQYPVEVGAARGIRQFLPNGIRVWVDHSVTPGPCTFTLANPGEQIPLSAGGCVGTCGGQDVYTTCFQA